MNIAEIEVNLKKLLKEFDKENFIYDLLLAYGQPKASIKRLRDGDLNLSKQEGEISWKKKLFYKEAKGADLHELIANLMDAESKMVKHDPRFIIVTDFKTLLAVDTKTNDTLDVSMSNLAKHFDFFLPWAGMEKAQLKVENPADVKAAEKMAKLYDDIQKDNPTKTQAEVHNLNVFLSRLLFCFFAEDTGIFEKGQFTSAISSHTQQDGSDLNEYLDKLFSVMNTEPSQRKKLPNYLSEFPYVNGGLFRNKHTAPKFSRKSRQSVIDSGELDWSAINPDIFGSMIQAVITPEHRGGLGMHYTSVPNIMKVIEPLFLNELYEEFEAANGNNKKLNALLQRIWNIKVFDPACGSGNFLIIAYKELRKLEMKIFKMQSALALSSISLGNFYGIELDDFAHEVAILSLWLAEHQMNQVFFAEFGRTKPALPLTETGNIVHGNACRLDWESVCPKGQSDEIYVLGNPPYLGSKNIDDGQRSDMTAVFKQDGKTLDYIAAWFLLASKYIRSYESKFAFVTTNSICQGEQVASLWSKVLSDSLEIFFAHTSFKWNNNAKNKAAVTVAIVGVRNKSMASKKLFDGKHLHLVENINPYLIAAKTIYVESKNSPISSLPEMVGGNVAYDSGNLVFEEREMYEFVEKNHGTDKYFKKLMGGKELLNGGIRYCLWLKDYELQEVSKVPEIASRIEKVKSARMAAKDAGTHKLADRPHQFRDLNNPNEYIAIPKTSSERRGYIPAAYLDDSFIPADSVRIIANAEPWIFAVISSKIHMAWMRTISGRLKTDYRYSKNLSYNTFPFPEVSGNQKKELEKHVYKVLEEREHHSEKTLAELYDPEKMPDGLREAHHQLDLAVERCYRTKPFESDEERLEYLFKLYEQMIEAEKNKDTLFEADTKPKRTRKK